MARISSLGIWKSANEVLPFNAPAWNKQTKNSFTDIHARELCHKIVQNIWHDVESFYFTSINLHNYCYDLIFLEF